MWSIYFETWARVWHDVAEALEAKERPVQWVVDFGPIRKNLTEIHPRTGLPRLIAPTKEWIERQLGGTDHAGLTVLFRIEPARGLTYALQGPRSVVIRARQNLTPQWPSSANAAAGQVTDA